MRTDRPHERVLNILWLHSGKFSQEDKRLCDRAADEIVKVACKWLRGRFGEFAKDAPIRLLEGRLRESARERVWSVRVPWDRVDAGEEVAPTPPHAKPVATMPESDLLAQVAGIILEMDAFDERNRDDVELAEKLAQNAVVCVQELLEAWKPKLAEAEKVDKLQSDLKAVAKWTEVDELVPVEVEGEPIGLRGAELIG